MNNIILVGFSRSGKSTIGKQLAEKTQKTFVELEEEIRNEGWIESDSQNEADVLNVLRKTIEKYMTRKNKIMALPVRLPLNDDLAEELSKAGTVIYLQTDKQELKQRVNDSESAINQEDFENREALFFKAASIIIQTTGKTPEEIVEEIVLLV